MDIEEAKKICKKMLLYAETQLLDYEAIAIETVLKELELKDKVIDEISIELSYINNEILDYYDKLPYADDSQKIKEYFTNKVKLQSTKQSQ